MLIMLMVHNSYWRSTLSVILPSMTMLNRLTDARSEVRTQHMCVLVRVRRFLRTRGKCLLHHVGPQSPRLPAKQTKQPSAAPGAESESLWSHFSLGRRQWGSGWVSLWQQQRTEQSSAVRGGRRTVFSWQMASLICCLAEQNSVVLESPWQWVRF